MGRATRSEAVNFLILSRLKMRVTLPRTLQAFVVSYIRVRRGASRFNFHIFNIILIRMSIHLNSVSIFLSDP